MRKGSEDRKTAASPIGWDARLLVPCFILLLTGHLLLSFAGLSTRASIWVGLFLVALPFLFMIGAAFEERPGKTDLLYRLEAFKSPGWILWILLVGLALGLRLAFLTSLSVWPGVDEGVHAFIALELSRHWHWNILSYCSQMPPFFFWLEVALFKLMGPSLRSLWLLPALLSFLPFTLAYRECRRYFSKSFSFLLAFGLGFGFWPLLAGRYSHPAVLVFPWTCLALAAAGRFLAAERGREILPAFFLGLIAGGGFYTYLSWPPVALFAAAVVLWKTRGFRRPFGAFMAALLVSLAPLVGVMIQNGYGSYLSANSVFSQPDAGLILLLSPIRYLRVLLWGDPHYYFYSSTWGGLLDPLAASFFWIGWAALFRPESRKIGVGVTLAMVLFLMPGLLAFSVNALRVIQCLPLALFCSAMGLQALAGVLPPLARGKVVLLALLTCAALDAYHLLGPYHHLWTTHQEAWPPIGKSVEYARAYPLLEEQSRKAGPGLVFTAFQDNLTDQSLTVASYPFNAALRPELDPANAQWAAWVCNINYQPFLQKRFPEGRWVWLAEGCSYEYGGLMLEIVPVTKENRDTLARWTAANQALLGVVDVLMRRKERQSYDQVRQALWAAEPWVQGDPFLESCLWDQVFNTYNSDVAYGERHPFKDFQGALAALDKALALGYPTAYFYNERGGMEAVVGAKDRAREDFERAIRCSLDKTSAADNLKALAGKTN